MPQNLEATSQKIDDPIVTETNERRATGGAPAGGERRKSVVDRRSGLERRRGPGKRRSESRRTAEEGELDAEQFEFVMAIDEYKRANNRPFPSWTEVLEVIKYLGYRKVADKGEHVDRPSAAEDAD
ncbi:MAG TPA: hypothetical protein P5081_11770 [Phycisphaerae bacterium]|nr:hypothetical protein [Phycisphaerae bacterium]HRW53558.1 hypothetical protein [Phycisphaerae bacterium]